MGKGHMNSHEKKYKCLNFQIILFMCKCLCMYGTGVQGLVKCKRVVRSSGAGVIENGKPPNEGGRN